MHPRILLSVKGQTNDMREGGIVALMLCRNWWEICANVFVFLFKQISEIVFETQIRSKSDGLFDLIVDFITIISLHMNFSDNWAESIDGDILKHCVVKIWCDWFYRFLYYRHFFVHAFFGALQMICYKSNNSTTITNFDYSSFVCCRFPC